MPQSSGPEITNASKGAHFLENVISIADMTHEPSTSSALLIAEYNIQQTLSGALVQHPGQRIRVMVHYAWDGHGR